VLLRAGPGPGAGAAPPVSPAAGQWTKLVRGLGSGRRRGIAHPGARIQVSAADTDRPALGTVAGSVWCGPTDRQRDPGSDRPRGGRPLPRTRPVLEPGGGRGLVRSGNLLAQRSPALAVRSHHLRPCKAGRCAQALAPDRLTSPWLCRSLARSRRTGLPRVRSCPSCIRIRWKGCLGSTGPSAHRESRGCRRCVAVRFHRFPYRFRRDSLAAHRPQAQGIVAFG